jgi:hypothetical protein
VSGKAALGLPLVGPIGLYMGRFTSQKGTPLKLLVASTIYYYSKRMLLPQQRKTTTSMIPKLNTIGSQKQ